MLESINLQCAHEYWDDGDNNPIRATQLHKLNEQQLNNLPTNNLVSERYLGAFGYLASLSAKRSNKFFKGIRIRDDLMFWGNQQETKAYERRDLAKVRKLDEMESVWNKQQQDLQMEHLNMSAKKKQRSNDFIDVVLSKCKLHGGPVTNAQEVKDIPKKQIISQT